MGGSIPNGYIGDQIMTGDSQDSYIRNILDIGGALGILASMKIIWFRFILACDSIHD